jgi:hypothetical protein
LVPKWLKGAEFNNVFIIPKNKVYLAEMINKLTICKKIVILTAQIGTQPLLTVPPIAYPLIKVAEVVAKNL